MSFRGALAVRRLSALIRNSVLKYYRSPRPLQVALFRISARFVALSPVVLPVGFAVSRSALGFKMASSDISKVTEECDRLYREFKMNEAYEILLPYRDSKDVEIMWRLARMTYKRHEFSPTDVKHSSIDEALKIIYQANEINPNHADVHKWWAILVGSRDTHPSFKAKIEDAFVIREHLNRALELNPNDGYTHYVFGKWCFEVAIVPWYQRKTASVLFATPPTSTLEEALQHFKDAERLHKNIFSRNDLMMAKCFIEMGKKDEAVPYLKKCYNNTASDVDAKNAAAEAKKLMDKLGVK